MIKEIRKYECGNAIEPLKYNLYNDSIISDYLPYRDNIIIDSFGRNGTNDFFCKIAKCALDSKITPQFMHGSVADVMYLRKFCEAVNISAGYWSPHKVAEYIDFHAVQKIAKWVNKIVTTM